MTKRIAVLTTGRQDFGILRSTVLGLHSDPRFELLLWAGGMHLERRFGSTISAIENEGIPVHTLIPFLAEPPDPAADAARALRLVAEALEAGRPDALVLLGDRSETLAAAVAATIMKISVIHLHGGEESEGAIDNAQRHAITKLSHLHLTTHRDHADRVALMGEEPDAVHVIPPPGVDNLYRDDLPSRSELLEGLSLPDTAEGPLVLVTVHPTTLSHHSSLAEVSAVSGALERLEGTFVVTLPNADEAGSLIHDFWLDWANERSNARVVPSLGERRYWGMMREADVMIGNSSSGVVEAPSACLPVVNVGDRQRGRLRHPMTLDVDSEADAILAAAQKACDPEFRARLEAARPLFRAGPAWPEILEILASWTPQSPPRKSFNSVTAGAWKPRDRTPNP